MSSPPSPLSARDLALAAEASKSTTAVQRARPLPPMPPWPSPPRRAGTPTLQAPRGVKVRAATTGSLRAPLAGPRPQPPARILRLALRISDTEEDDEASEEFVELTRNLFSREIAAHAAERKEAAFPSREMTPRPSTSQNTTPRPSPQGAPAPTPRGHRQSESQSRSQSQSQSENPRIAVWNSVSLEGAASECLTYHCWAWLSSADGGFFFHETC